MYTLDIVNKAYVDYLIEEQINILDIFVYIKKRFKKKTCSDRSSQKIEFTAIIIIGSFL